MKVGLASICILAALTVGASRAQAEIKVGVVLSATGPGSALGQPQIKTVAALPKEIAGEKIVYIVLDDESDPAKGLQNARRLVIQDHVDVLVGSSLTPVTLPMLDVALEAKTPLLSMAASTAIVQPMEFRAALRDELERGKDIYLNNGLSNMTPTDHNGYDERSAFLIKVEGGKFRLLQ